MCTVKKDITLPDSAMASVDSTPAPAKTSPTSVTDYDLINRQQSQLLLDMIYSSSRKKPCFFSSKMPCPGTAAAAAAAASVSTSDKAILEEIHKIKASIADLQTQINKLPQQIVAAIAEAQACRKIRNDLDDEDFEEFDKLSSASEVMVLPPIRNCGNMSGRTSMSSDIEVLNYCTGRPSCSGTSSSSIMVTPSSSSASIPRNPAPMMVIPDISKEIAHLTNKLNSIVLPTVSSTELSTPTSEQQEQVLPSSDVAKEIAASLFANWEQRYTTSKSEIERLSPSSSAAPIGNIRCHQEVALKSPTIPKILPYSPSIDLSVWLK